MGLSSTYLVGYNSVQTLGWLYILVLTVKVYADGKTPADVYDTVSDALKLFQTAAVLEIVHAAIGIVRSPVMTTLTQVFSRVLLTWGVAGVMPEVEAHRTIFFTTMVLAWSITEVIRYSFYAFSVAGKDKVPGFLTYLRYTLFIVLYPIGVTSELAQLIMLVPTADKVDFMRYDMPNSLNVSFNYRWFLVMAMIAYIPGFPQLYGYMFKQRKKVLSEKKKSA